MLKLQIQGDLHLGVEDHLASSLTTGESRAARTLPHNIRPLQQWPRARLENLSAEQQAKTNPRRWQGRRVQKHFSGCEPDSVPHHLEQLLVACTGFLIGESMLHIEFHAEYRAPGSKMLEQHHAAFCFADHYAATSLRAVCAADQLEAVTMITFCADSHVLNQLGVSSLLPLYLGNLPSDAVKLHLFSKVKPLFSARTMEVLQRRRLQFA